MTTGHEGADEMEDYAAFCRNRLRTCFHRRRKYPVGSDDWTLAVTEARMFIRNSRAERQWREMNPHAQADKELIKRKVEQDMLRRITPYDPEFEAQMEVARRVMKKRRNALRELAK
jgi:hypothetical protein